MRIRRAATVALEVAHLGMDGVLHGHSLTAEVWTDAEVDLDSWRLEVAAAATSVEGRLEETIGGRTFEKVALALLDRLPAACRVLMRLPTRGHVVEVAREG